MKFRTLTLALAAAFVAVGLGSAPQALAQAHAVEHGPRLLTRIACAARSGCACRVAPPMASACACPARAARA